MQRHLPLLLLAALVAAVLVVSIWFRTWGGFALVLAAGVGVAWYRLQVERSADAEIFFGDAGEETRLTGFQGGTGSEVPPAPGEKR